MPATIETARVAQPSKRPWLARYPTGVPADIDEAALVPLGETFAATVQAHPDQPAFESFGHRLTYREIGDAARRFAGWLQSKGLKPGDRVAIMMPNVMAYPAALYGVLIGGFTVVNVNPLYTARELTHQLDDSGAKALVVLENFAHVVAAARPQLPDLDHVLVAGAGDLLGLKGAVVNFIARRVRRVVPAFSLPDAVPFAAALAEGRPFTAPAIGVDDIAFLQYTGGTTGVAKGAMLTHRNVAANVAQCTFWFDGILKRAKGGPVMVTALPLYHIFALTCCCLYMVRVGGCCLLVANPRDIPGFVKMLRSRPFNMIAGVNTLYNALTQAPGIGKVNFRQLVFCVAGGMATQDVVANRWKTLTGTPIVEGYGLSETSPVACINPPEIPAFTGTIGFPVPSTDISIRDVDGNELPEGHPGELCIKGPQVMAGYWKRPDETLRVMTADGFFRSGDIARVDAKGEVRLVDRMKDMILVSGFNVYPNEVEGFVATHPDVAEVAVIGRPDGHTGEAVVAYVVRRNPDLTEADLRRFCRTGLTAYKVPKHVVFRDSLPKSNVGKVLRRELREEGDPTAGV